MKTEVLFLLSILSIGFCEELKCTRQNEYVSEYTSICPINCETIKSKFRCMAPDILKPSCQCITGTVRDVNTGNCIKIEDCPKTALLCNKANEVYSSSTPVCPLSCKNQTPNKCMVLNTPSCQCILGTFRDDNKNCVKPEQCLQ